AANISRRTHRSVVESQKITAAPAYCHERLGPPGSTGDPSLRRCGSPIPAAALRAGFRQMRATGPPKHDPRMTSAMVETTLELAKLGRRDGEALLAEAIGFESISSSRPHRGRM